MVLDRELMLGAESVPKSGYLWCLHCERTYRYGRFRLVEMKLEAREVEDLVKAGVKDRWIRMIEEPVQMCPYPDCDGDVFSDAWNWERIKVLHSDYPEVPEADVVYSMY